MKHKHVLIKKLYQLDSEGNPLKAVVIFRGSQSGQFVAEGLLGGPDHEAGFTAPIDFVGRIRYEAKAGVVVDFEVVQP